MSKVLCYLKPYSGMVLLIIALLFAQAACDLALPDFMSDMINKAIMNNNLPLVWGIGGKMLLVTLAGAIASIAVGYFASLAGAGACKTLRRDVFEKVEGFSQAEFDRFSTASLITRTTNDITQIQTLIIIMLRLIFYAPILGIGGIIKALAHSTSMTWVIGVAVIVLVGVIGMLMSVTMPRFKLVQTLVDRLNLVTRENLDGMLVIRAFNAQQFEAKRFDVANEELTKNNLFVNRAMATLMPFMMLVMNLTTVIIVWVGSKQVSAFQVDIGDMMAYMQYGMQILMAFLMLAVMFILIPRAAVSADRVQDVLEAESSLHDPAVPQVFQQGYVPTVEFRNVSFRYPGSEGDVLKNISFTAKPGQITAFIGATGSGKTTLMSLVLRFYDVTEGQVLVGGKDVRDVAQKDLRRQIGFVPQKSNLFSGTIRTNLTYGRPDAEQSVIDKAAAVSQSAEFIESKPGGYEEPIAQGGTNVSGGQRQRLSIARALVKDAPVYIFDDSFSALDLKTDAALRAALRSEISNSTILLIGQRISSIMSAEQIVVLDHGRVVGLGTHEQLLKSCPVYQEIAYSQLSEEELTQ